MSDVMVRFAEREDAAAVESLRISTWKTAYRGLVPDDVLDGLTVDVGRRAELIEDPTTTTLLALRDGDPTGMAVFGPCRDEDRPSALELYALYVRADAWRSGTGSALLARCPGVTSLWVLEQNVRARAFYARHGFAPDGTSKVQDLGAPVVEIRLLVG